MPDRAIAHAQGARAAKQFKWVVYVLLVCITIMSVITLFSVYGAYNATNALKVSSKRAECRTIVVNNETDEFRQDLTQVLDAQANHDQAKIRSTVDKLLTYPSVNDLIEQQCPRPLATQNPKTSSTTIESTP